MFAVDLPDTAQSQNIFNLRGLCCYAIRVEKLRSTSPPQCRNCQKFLHKSNECRAPPCCRLCAGEHPARECRLSPKEPRCCANCYGEHPADSKNCKFWRAAMQANSQRESQTQRAQTHSPAQVPQAHKGQTRSNTRQAQATPPKPRGNTQPQSSPDAPYSTIVTRALVHAEASPPPRPQPQEQQQQLPKQQQQRPVEQATRTTNTSQNERDRALEELRRRQRESQELQHREYVQSVRNRELQDQVNQTAEPPKSPRRRRSSGKTLTKQQTELQLLKEQVKKQQLDLQKQQQTLAKQQKQLAERQAQLTAEAKQLRERQLRYENEKRRQRHNPDTVNTQTQDQTHHRGDAGRPQYDCELMFSRRAENVTHTLRHMEPSLFVPRLLNALYEAYRRLYADPRWHTLPEVILILIGHLIGSYDHTYPTQDGE